MIISLKNILTFKKIHLLFFRKGYVSGITALSCLCAKCQFSLYTE